VKHRYAARILASVISLAFALVGSATARAAAPSTVASGSSAPSGCSAAYFRGDARLGPLRLSKVGADGNELRGYRRTGGLSTSQFLSTYWNAAANSC